MSLIAIPNLSEGRDARVIAHLSHAVPGAGASLLDVHSDEVHHRTVITAAGHVDVLVSAMTGLAERARSVLDLRTHAGVHPRVGVIDVCPFVPTHSDMDAAVEAAIIAGERIAADAGIPVYLYGEAARREQMRELPGARRAIADYVGGTSDRWPPDIGGAAIDPRTGVACVGARGPLIAFNVWLEADVTVARAAARQVRAGDGGLIGVRALGLAMSDRLSQISMNLTRPEDAGIDAAFEVAARLARAAGVRVTRTEVVGLLPERYAPDPMKEAARLMDPPSRLLEPVLRSAGPGSGGRRT